MFHKSENVKSYFIYPVILLTQKNFYISLCSSKKIVCALVQQASEKIDRTRAHAGEIFLRMLYCDR